jgi:uncharacterized protein
MNRIKEFFVPQEKKFFNMINQQAMKIQEGILLVQDMVNNFDNIEQRRIKVKNIEHEADQFVHSILNELNSTFITPIDREDISALTFRLDDIMDNSYAAVNRIHLYDIKAATMPMKELSQCLVSMMEQLILILSKMHDGKNSEEIRRRCIEINRLENVADEILNHAMANLFKEKNTMEVIKLKDVYEYLENAADKCEDVANVISDILIKNS